mmetsp:Transcript_83697/g.231974  ORF Transcript_83697/g.231974 Transcript_83697/m.231974 type:complete len:341 (-) Transcript_83697:71-1093(-)
MGVVRVDPGGRVGGAVRRGPAGHRRGRARTRRAGLPNWPVVLRAARLLGAGLRARSIRTRASLSPLLGQHTADLVLHIAPLDDVGGGRSLGLVPVQEVPAKDSQLLGVSRRHLWHWPPGDLLHQGLDVLGFEGHAERGHLVNDAAKSPNVAPKRVGLLLADLWAEIVRGANCRPSKGHSALEHLGDAEVTHPQTVRRGEEKVLALEIPMQDVLVMHVLQRQGDLSKPPEDLPLAQGLARLAGAVDPLVEVAPVREVHHYGQGAVLGEALAIAHYVRVLQARQHPHLVDGVAPLLLVHGAHVDGFHHVELAFLVLDEGRLAIAALADLSDLDVAVASSGRT